MYDKQYSSGHKNQCYNLCLCCYLYSWFWAAKFGYICLPKSWFSCCLVTLWNSKQIQLTSLLIFDTFQSNWHNYQILTLIFFNLTPRVSNLMRFEAWSFIKRFTKASSNLSKFSKMFLVDLKLERRNGAYRAIENKTRSKIHFFELCFFKEKSYL